MSAPTRIALLVLILAAFSPRPAFGQACSRAWEPGPEGVRWSVPAAHTTPTNILAAVVWDPDQAGPLLPRLVLGGEFDRAGDVAASNIVAWDGSYWYPIGLGLNNKVRSLTVHNGALVAGGDFTLSGATPARHVAYFNNVSWQAFGNGPPVPPDCLASYQGRVWSGGSWVGGTENSFHSWTGSAWVPGPTAGILFGDNPIHNPVVMFSWGDTLAALGSIPGYGIYRIGGLNGDWDEFGEYMYPLRSMALHNNILYIGGVSMPASSGVWAYSTIARTFTLQPFPILNQGLTTALTSYNGRITAAIRSLAVTTQTQVYALADGTPITLGNQISGGDVKGLISFNNNLYAYGPFTRAGNRAATHVARLNGPNWEPLATGFNLPPSTMATFGSALWVAGAFNRIGNIAAQGLAFLNNGQWTAAIPPNGEVLLLAAYSQNVAFGSRLLVGGNFTSAFGIPASRLVSLDNLAPPSPAQVGNGLDSYPLAMTTLSAGGGNNTLIIGGNFVVAGGLTCNRIARLVGGAWQQLGNGFNGTVRALATYNGRIVAAGDFDREGNNGAAHNSIATWSGTAWLDLGTGFNNTVYALAVYNGELYAGGPFTALGGPGGAPMSNIARWNGTTWQPVATGLDGQVNALRVVDGTLVIAGAFTGPPGAPNTLMNIAVWNGSTLRALDRGVNGQVQALATNGSDLYAGGFFTSAGDESTQFFARATPVSEPTITTAPIAALECTGGTATLFAQAAGCTGGTVIWRRNNISLGDGPTGFGSTIVGAGLNVLRIENLAPQDAGTYTADFTCPCGQASTSTTLSVALPVAISAQPTPATFCTGAPLSLSIAVTGTGPIAYQWRQNNAAISGQTSATLNIPITQAASAGTYDCLVSNACNTIISSPTLVTLNCCRADFNGTGGITIQDLFDYLTAWFAQTPSADFNGIGGITLQDLFDFLAAWFARCL